MTIIFPCSQDTKKMRTISSTSHKTVTRADVQMTAKNKDLEGQQFVSNFSCRPRALEGLRFFVFAMTPDPESSAVHYGIWTSPGRHQH